MALNLLPNFLHELLHLKFDIPIVGIIEPTIQYVKKQKYKEIGVIATEGTIRNCAWEKKLKENIPNINVISRACPMLATIAEEGRTTGEEGRNAIREYMKPFKEKRIDKIILGCTHFPIYEQVIRKELGYDVELINTGRTVSNYLKKYLNEKNLMANKEIGKIETYLTKEEKEFSNIMQNILKIQ